jgi:hypothetical protein
MYQNYRELGFAVAKRAVKDYFKVNPAKQKVILKELRSDWMMLLTDGASESFAEQLVLHPKEIKERLGKYDEEEN